jgi:hypothetical protein
MLEKFSDDFIIDLQTINYLAADKDKTAYLIGLYDGREFMTDYETGKMIANMLEDLGLTRRIEFMKEVATAA